MKTVFHIGNPKAWSTSIQSMLVDREGDTYRYLGFRPSANKNEWYSDKNIAGLLNYDLRFIQSSRFKLKKDKYRKYFEEIYSKCSASGQDLWISSENVSSRFILEEIGPLEKISRIQEILSGKILFVVIFRNIYETIQSIYLEYLKQGYTKTFTDFCDETYLFREANFLYSLFPGHQLTSLHSIITDSNDLKSHFISADKKNTGKKLLEFLSSIITGTQFTELENKNTAIYKNNAEKCRRKNSNSLSMLDATGMIENHRIFWHLEQELQEYFDTAIWGKLRRQMEIRNKVMSTSNHNGHSLKITGYLKEFLDETFVLDQQMAGKYFDPDACHDYQELWKENEK